MEKEFLIRFSDGFVLSADEPPITVVEGMIWSRNPLCRNPRYVGSLGGKRNPIEMEPIPTPSVETLRLKIAERLAAEDEMWRQRFAKPAPIC